MYAHTFIYKRTYVTRPVKTGHICTQICIIFQNLSLCYFILTNDILIKLSVLIYKFIRNYIKLTEVIYRTWGPRNVSFSEHV